MSASALIVEDEPRLTRSRSLRLPAPDLHARRLPADPLASTRGEHMATKKKKAPERTTAKKSAKKSAKASASKTLRDTAEERAAALPAETAEQNPQDPVAQLAAWALRTAEIASPVSSQLKKLSGFDDVWLNDLRPAVALLTDAESKWSAARAKSRAGVAPARVKEALALRSEIVEAGRYLLRKDAVAQQELDQVLEGTGVADLALDLDRLAALVEKNAVAFSDGGVPASTPADARKMAKELSTGVAPEDSSDLQARRNRLFHLVDGDLKELLAGLRFLWRKQPTKLALLGVSYASQLKRGQRAKKKTQTPSASVAVPA